MHNHPKVMGREQFFIFGMVTRVKFWSVLSDVAATDSGQRRTSESELAHLVSVEHHPWMGVTLDIGGKEG